MPDNMIQLIDDFDLIPPDSTVLCAVSGGADSVCLLMRLLCLRFILERPFTLVAAHYNHRLRGEESDRDEQFVRRFVADRCKEQKVYYAGNEKLRLFPPVQLIVGSGDVAGEARRRKQGIEETARQMRYAFLQETAQKLGGALIATAHTADDNAETVLLHLSRGSGLRGLTGIAPRRDNLIRPLLTTTRAEVEEYLRVYGLPHIEDSSNTDETYARNRVRRQVVPVLEGLYPGLAARMAGEIARFRADEDYLTAQAEEIAAQAVQNGETLSLPAAAIGGAANPLAARAVRSLIGRLNGGDQDCAAVHLEAAVALCRGRDPSAQIHLPYGLTARREYDAFVLTREVPPESCPTVSLPLPGGTNLGRFRVTVCAETYQSQPQTAWDFWLSGELEVLTARSRRVGDALKRPGRPGRTLKKIMIDEKIPRHLRETLPVLEHSGMIAAVAGLGPDEAFLPKDGEPSWHVAITPEKNGLI